ncbi:DUF1275 domain-containing protein [Tetragenococcus osmophilus]|uniref:DUF1275 domain-containing protein n=1 Tax=Tetragenococcus osmophilus TaxID=526944 RepID=A0AA37XHL7_9ENTE|nr:YoaK family protein [Tetragenococcus osmophilus]AYW47088.1 DUF1275 domain-containing protein [Tetragenococcus osmophilus]GMA71068.1 hypothetical protein GCM10025885_01170 [Tetragenococcus osmophilus]
MENLLQKIDGIDAYIHYLIALCGGFFGVYALVSRMGNLGQAQTANLIEMIGNILGKNLSEGFIRIIAAFLFMGGIIFATVLEKSSKTKIDLRYLSIFFDLIAAGIIGFFPLSMNPIIALYPVFFAAAFQWCIFKGAKGYASATIFCSNNLKQTTISVIEYFLLTKNHPDRKEKIEKIKFYVSTIVSFYTGVIVGYLLWYFYGVHSIWFVVCPLLMNVGLVFLDKKKSELAFTIQNDSIYETTT